MCESLVTSHPPVLFRRSSTEVHGVSPIYGISSPTPTHHTMTIGPILTSVSSYNLIKRMLRDEHKSRIMETTPNRLHPLLEGAYHTIFPESRSTKPVNRVESVPDVLPRQHLDNITIHSDREGLLTSLPQEGTVAELGVDEGDFSETILSTTNPNQLFLVDVWGSERYGEEKYEKVKEKFESKDEVSIIRERSEVAMEDFDDDFFDWVYIDTTHSYEQTSKELEISRRKVKEGGLIAGHDYCVGNASKGFLYGVISAVHEFCVRENWEITHLSLETHGHSSFALEKITS